MVAVMKLPFNKLLCHRAKVVFILFKAFFAGVIHMIERENNAKLFSVIAGHKLTHFNSGTLTFADRKCIVL